jgi:hypothetical protein
MEQRTVPMMKKGLRQRLDTLRARMRTVER